MINNRVISVLVRRGRQISLFSTEEGSKNLELLRQSQKLQQNVTSQLEKIKELESELKEENKKLATRNKQIHELRVQLTNDIKKGDEIWSRAKRIKQENIKASVQNFSRSLISLEESLQSIKSHQTQEHGTELTQGFQLTHRLFFSTLEKFKIVRFSPETGKKYQKDKMHVIEELEAQDPKKKATVAEVVEEGWEAEGKVIKKANVKIYK